MKLIEEKNTIKKKNNKKKKKLEKGRNFDQKGTKLLWRWRATIDHYVKRSFNNNIMIIPLFTILPCCTL